MARSKKDIDKERMYQKILPTAKQPEASVEQQVTVIQQPTPVVRQVEPVTVIQQTAPAAPQPVVQPVVQPAVNAQPAAVIQPAAAVAQPEPISAAPQHEAAVQPAAVPVPAAAPVPSPAQIPAQQPAPQLLPVNLMEGFVASRIDEVMRKFKCCDCDKCRRDILAMTLNKLPPLYVLEDDLNTRDQREKERSADVAAALVKSVLAVKANPRH